VPGLEQFWFDRYGHVARTGEAIRFENGSDVMGRWFDVYALRVGTPEARRVAILFNDISARRRARLQLREMNDTLERRVERAVASALWADVIENTDALIAVVSPDFRFLALNSAYVVEFERINVCPHVGDVLPDLMERVPAHRGGARHLAARAGW
jgi:PAS domain-containing protein